MQANLSQPQKFILKCVLTARTLLCEGLFLKQPPCDTSLPGRTLQAQRSKRSIKQSKGDCLDCYVVSPNAMPGMKPGAKFFEWARSPAIQQFFYEHGLGFHTAE